VTKTKSISAGLDYPGVGPEHAFLKDSGRATYVPVTGNDDNDDEIMMSEKKERCCIMVTINTTHNLHYHHHTFKHSYYRYHH